METADSAADRELVRDYVDGQTEAYHTVSRWIRLVVDSRHWGLSHQREDILQEVHRRLYENLKTERFEGTARLKTYTVQIAKYTCIEFLRRKIRASAIETLDEGSIQVRARDPAPDEQLARREREDYAAEALARLPEPCRELFRLIFQEQLSYQVIGKRLGIAEGTVKSRAWRCRDALASILEKRGVRQKRRETG